MINENDKKLIKEFFKIMHSCLDLFNNAEKKWEVLPECNTYLNELYKIGREMSIDDEKINKNFEDIILDIESMIVMKRNDESLLERHKVFIEDLKHF